MFLRDQHISYIKGLESLSNNHLYDHLFINALYWSVLSLYLLGDEIRDKAKILKQVLDCLNVDGSFGSSQGMDGHLLHTLSALQILVLIDCVDKIDKEKTINYIKGLQNDDGSFMGDEWGEVDTRFSYCAVQSFVILGGLSEINTDKIIEYVVKCQNIDGAFGSVIGSESHAGQVFCCVGVLSILDSLHLIDSRKLGWWLGSRQLSNGGLNGRPEKLEDVCYSWWVLSSLWMIKKENYINHQKLHDFILSCQDEVGLRFNN